MLLLWLRVTPERLVVLRFVVRLYVLPELLLFLLCWYVRLPEELFFVVYLLVPAFVPFLFPFVPLDDWYRPEVAFWFDDAWLPTV